MWQSVWRALFIGVQLASAEAWRRRLITGAMVASFLSSILVVLRANGIDIPVSDEDLAAIGAGVVALGGVLVSLLTVLTSTDVGFRHRAGPGDLDGMDEGAGRGPVAGDSRVEGGAGGGSRPDGVQGDGGGVSHSRPGPVVRPVDPFRDHGA